MRSKDHLNRPSHCYVKAHCLCNFPHKSRLATHPASPHSSRCVMIVPYLSQFCWHLWPGDPCHDYTVTQRDSHVTTHHKTWHSGFVEKMFSHQQVLRRRDTREYPVFLLGGSTDCCECAELRSFTNYPVPESRPPWLLTLLTNQKPGQWVSGQWEDSSCSVHFSLSPPRLLVSEISAGNMRTEQTRGNGQQQDGHPWHWLPD